MIDTKELRRLVQAALAAPDGLSAEWMDRLGQFQEAADASVVSELLGRLGAAESDALEQARLNGMVRDELLEALKEMVGLVELMCPFDGPQQRKARTAIARASGEHP